MHDSSQYKRIRRFVIGENPHAPSFEIHFSLIEQKVFKTSAACSRYQGDSCELFPQAQLKSGKDRLGHLSCGKRTTQVRSAISFSESSLHRIFDRLSFLL